MALKIAMLLIKSGNLSMKYEYPGKEIRRRKFLIVAAICKIIGNNW